MTPSLSCRWHARELVVAYNKATGAPVWKALNDEASYTSPMLVTLAAFAALVVTATRVVGLTRRQGHLVVGLPLEHVQRHQRRAADCRLRTTGAIAFHVGVIRPWRRGVRAHVVAGDRFQAKTIWENERMKNKFTSSVLHNGHIYGLDESILASVERRDGRAELERRPYGYGQLVLAGDHLVC
jgi:outer membrane protein assembly factor BamB